MPKTTTLTQDEIEASPSVLHADSAVATDDIPDPALPMQVIADLQHQRVTQPMVDPGTPSGQVVITLDEALHVFTQQAATVLHSVEKSWDAALRIFNGNQQVIEALTAALLAYKPLVPYSGSVSVLTPAGYPLTLTVQAANQEAFMVEMGGMLGFFQDNGFAVPQSQGIPF